MNTCETLKGYLAAYADGELEGELCERVRVHLAECEPCRNECTALKRVAELYRDSAPPEVRTEDWETVTAALDACMLEGTTGIETLRARAEKRRARRGGWWLFPAAALAAAAVLVTVLVNPPASTPPATRVVSVETDPDFEAMVRVPVDKDDFLIIDVVHVE